jgi:hypothetical protein
VAAFWVLRLFAALRRRDWAACDPELDGKLSVKSNLVKLAVVVFGAVDSFQLLPQYNR